MSFFLITNNKKRTNVAEKEFCKLFNKNTKTTNLNNQLYLTYTPAYKNHILKKKTKNGYIFGFGTFFTKDGFHEDALGSIEDLRSFLKQEEKGLFGHYILIIEEEEFLYVVTDKVGMINVYYTEKDGYFYISNDLISASISSSNTSLSEVGAQQFILKGSNIGKFTIFQNIFRLGLGNMLKVTKNNIKQEKIFSYSLEKLTFDEYIERIKNYFTYLNNFNGKIATDMSGGFDTRLIASIGHKLVSELEANTNSNQFDHGIDETLAPIVAERLSLPLTIISNEANVEIEKSLMLHGFSAGRDIIRSRQWPKRLKNKYEKYSLSLGGYGGEVIRAKYNKSNRISQIVQGYYRGADAKSLFGSHEYIFNTSDELKSYLFKDLKLNNQNANWIYTVDRMRIWGGSQVLMSSLYGEILHPFMDWYLINPIFSWNTKELEGGKLQQEIINRFAPQLINIPINKLVKKDSNFLIKLITKLKIKVLEISKIKMIVIRIRKLLYRKRNKQKLAKFYDFYPRSNLECNILTEINIDLKNLERFGDIDLISRIATVIEAFNHVKK